MGISRGGLRHTYRLRQYAAKDGKRQLQLFVIASGREIEIGTPIRLLMKDWDKKNKRVLNTDPFATEYREWMHAAEQRLAVVAKNFFGREEEITREVLSRAISGAQAADEGTLAEAMEAHRLVKARQCSAGTMEVYSAALQSIKRHRIGATEVRSIKRADVELYIRALQGEGLENQSIEVYLSQIKTVLRERKKRGVLEYEPAAFDVKLKRKEIYTVALTLEEVERWSAAPVTTKGEATSKDIFLLGCFTGMRISDILTMRVSDIRLDEGIIVRNQKKTGGTVTIPILPVIEHILTDRIDGKSANDKIFQISYQVVITSVKIIAQRAGLDRPVLTGRLTGTVVQEEYLPLYDVIATHAARRTFVTIAQSLNFDPLFIMKITGHRNLQAFQRYYRLTMTDKVLTDYKERWGAIATQVRPTPKAEPTAAAESVRCVIRTVLGLRVTGLPAAVVLGEKDGPRQFYGHWVGADATGIDGLDYVAIEVTNGAIPANAEAAVREAITTGRALPFHLAEEVVLKHLPLPKSV